MDRSCLLGYDGGSTGLPPMNGSPPAVNAPRIILVALGLLLGVHVLRLMLGPAADVEVLRLFAFIPARYSDVVPGVRFEFGGGLAAKIWSFVTYMVLHGDWTHLIFNSLWLLAFGSAVAWRIGTERFIAFTICCGVAGALFHLAAHWGEPFPVIGASAAISGHMAGAIRFVFRAAGPFGALGRPGEMQRRVPLASIAETFQERRSLAFLAVWLFINLGLGLGAITFGEATGIAWEAHIGGFAFGLFFFGLFDRKLPPLRAF